MKLFKILVFLALSIVMLTSFTQCKSSKETSNLKQLMKTIDKASFTLDKTYYQSWVAGVRGGGSGVYLYISVLSNKNNTVLDSAYFRGMQTKIEIGKMGHTASFKTAGNPKDDIIMSNNKNAEYGNKIPNNKKFPFDLKDNQCVISYMENNATHYLLVDNLIEKKRVDYPSAPPRRL